MARCLRNKVFAASIANPALASLLIDIACALDAISNAYTVEQPLDLALVTEVPQGNTTTNEDQGTLVNVRSNGTLYTLVTQQEVIDQITDSFGAADGNQVVTTSAGALYVALEQLTSFQTEYHIDETDGDDGNYGYYSAALAPSPKYGPLASVEEALRRIGISRVTPSQSIDIIFDLSTPYTNPIHVDVGTDKFLDVTPSLHRTAISLRGPTRSVLQAGSGTIAVGAAGPNEGEMELVSGVSLDAYVGYHVRITSGLGADNGQYVAIAAIVTAGSRYRISPLVRPLTGYTLESNLFEFERIVVVDGTAVTFDVIDNPKLLSGGSYFRSAGCFINLVDVGVQGFFFDTGRHVAVRSKLIDNDAVLPILRIPSETNGANRLACNQTILEFYGTLPAGPEAQSKIAYNGALQGHKALAAYRAWQLGVAADLRVNSDSMFQGPTTVNATTAPRAVLVNTALFVIGNKAQLATAQAIQPRAFMHDFVTGLNVNLGDAFLMGRLSGGQTIAGVGPDVTNGIVVNSEGRGKLSSTSVVPNLRATNEVTIGGITMAYAALPATHGVDTPGASLTAAGAYEVAGGITANRGFTGAPAHVGSSGVYDFTLSQSLQSTVIPKVEAVARASAANPGAYATAEIVNATTITVRTFTAPGVAGDVAFTLNVVDRANMASFVINR